MRLYTSILEDIGHQTNQHGVMEMHSLKREANKVWEHEVKTAMSRFPCTCRAILVSVSEYGCCDTIICDALTHLINNFISLNINASSVEKLDSLIAKKILSVYPESCRAEFSDIVSILEASFDGRYVEINDTKGTHDHKENPTGTVGNSKLDDIENRIISVHFFTAADGYVGKCNMAVRQSALVDQLQRLVICTVVLNDNTCVTGDFLATDNSNIEYNKGKTIAYKNAIEKLLTI